jgi:hypothetical protein
MIKIESEEDAYLILSWISDTIDEKVYDLLQNYGSIETLEIINNKPILL